MMGVNDKVKMTVPMIVRYERSYSKKNVTPKTTLRYTVQTYQTDPIHQVQAPGSNNSYWNKTLYTEEYQQHQTIIEEEESHPQEDSLGEDSLDGARQEEVHQEEVRQEGVCQEEVRQEEVHPLPLYQSKCQAPTS
jgi:hypothetical protein